MTKWILKDDNGTEREIDTFAEAERVKDELEELGATVSVSEKEETSNASKVEVDGAEVIEMSGEDGGNTEDSDDDNSAVDDGDDSEDVEMTDDDVEDEHAERIEATPEPVEEDVPTNAADKLPDEKPGVDTDPLSWVPGDFVDIIDGTPAINRKGFEVICQHYGVSIKTDMIETPSDNDWTACIHKARAITEDGIEYAAYGSSHVERGDDKALLVSMSDTRAYKRAASRATGVGMLAVEELQAATVGGGDA